MRKYGGDVFDHEVLEVCPTFEDALVRETFWVAERDSTTEGHGYNMTHGGMGVVMTEEVKVRHRQATSEGTREAYKRPEVRENHQKAIDKVNSDVEFVKRRSTAAGNAQKRPEVRAKKSVAGKEAWKTSEALHAMCMPVLQIDMKTANVIAEFPSAKAAARANPPVDQQNVSACANGHCKTARGFVWAYKENVSSREDILKMRQFQPKKKITRNSDFWKDPVRYEELSQQRRGENNGMAVVTEEIVRQIRSDYERVDENKFGEKAKFCNSWAEKLEMSNISVMNIIRRKTWKNVE